MTTTRRLYLWLEMASLFIAVPGFFALLVHPGDPADHLFAALGLGFLNAIPRPVSLLFPALAVFTVAILITLIRDPGFNKRQLWNWPATRRDLPRLAAMIAGGAIVLVAAALLLDRYTTMLVRLGPDGQLESNLFWLPRERPAALLLILLLYPPLSAYPQELTHRAFFFHRYEPLFPSRTALIITNAIVFAWLHVPFLHWMALALTLPGGLLFAWTYARTRSLLACAIEHGLLGWSAFAVGLGWFVYTGSITR